MESSILLLARLDAWVGTVVTCVQEPDGRGGQRQRMFSSCFSKLLPLATAQLLSHVRDVVHSYLPSELEVLAVGDEDDDDDDMFGNDTRRKATFVVTMPSESVLYVSVRDDWFITHVSAELGSILDCYIGRCVGPGLPVHRIMETVEEQEQLDAVVGERVAPVDEVECQYDNPVANCGAVGGGAEGYEEGTDWGSGKDYLHDEDAAVDYEMSAVI